MVPARLLLLLLLSPPLLLLMLLLLLLLSSAARWWCAHLPAEQHGLLGHLGLLCGKLPPACTAPACPLLLPT
jgi:hypothetical protein